MKLKPFYYLTVALLALLLASCNAIPSLLSTPTALPTATPTPAPTTPPSSAVDILAQATAAMEQVESMLFTYTVKVDAAGQAMTTDGQGAFQKPDQMYMKLSVLGQNIEMLMLGPDKFYVKMPGSDKFSLAPTALSGLSGAPDILAQLKVGDFASTTTLEGEEILDGVPTNVVSFDMDVAKYLQTDQANASVFDPAKTTGKGKIWIGKEDGLIYKLALEMNMDVADNPVTMQTEMLFSNFNEPVDMPQP
jgi:outer membrane lipoprotein-sorting protein